MSSNRLALIIVGVACVGASGVGSYLATRGNVGRADVAASAALAPPSAPSAEPGTSRDATTPATVAAAPTTVAEPVRPAARTGGTARTTVATKATRDTAAPKPRSESPRSPSTSDEPLQASQTASPVGMPAAAPAEPPVADLPPAADEHPPTAVADAPPPRTAQELVVASDSVIGIQTEGLISSDRARLEDRVEARVVRDVKVNGVVAIPAGTRALGTVVLVERGGKVRDRARLGIRFSSLRMPNGTVVNIDTEPIYRWGDSPTNGSSARIGGGAVAGAILGAIIGGGKGAAIGAATGAGAGTAAVMSSEPTAATFPSGTELTARIVAPIVVVVDRE